MKPLLLVSCLVLLLCGSIKAQAPKFMYDMEMDSSNLTDPQVIKALDVWKQYILHPSDSLILDDGYSRQLVHTIHDQILNPQWPIQYSEVHFLNFRKDGRIIYLESMTEFREEKWNVDYVLSYITVGAVPSGNTYKLFFMTKRFLESIPKINSEWITYYNNSSRPLTKATIRSANRFCDSVAKAFGLTQTEPGTPTRHRKVNYVMSDLNRAYEIYGQYYNWNSPPSQTNTIGNETYILDNTTPGDYRHELVHYLFNQYQPLWILNEGLATWLGGPGHGQTFDSAVAGLKALPYQDTAVISKIATRQMPYWQPVYFYTLGGIILHYAYKQGGIEKVKELLADKQNKDIFSLISEHFDLKNYATPQEMLVEMIKEENAGNGFSK